MLFVRAILTFSTPSSSSLAMHLELGQYSMQSALRVRAKPGHANCPMIAMNVDEFGRTNQSDHHVL